MALSRVSTSALAAIAGMAMLISASTQSSAFTLAGPSPAMSVASPEIQPVWWDRWGRWHPIHRRWGWRRWGPPPPPEYGYYPPPGLPAFGFYAPPAPPAYGYEGYYGPREHWGDDD